MLLLFCRPVRSAGTEPKGQNGKKRCPSESCPCEGACSELKQSIAALAKTIRLKRASTIDDSELVDGWAVEQASATLAHRGMLRDSTARFGKWLAVPHTTPALALATGTMSSEVFSLCKGNIKNFEDEWVKRHLAIRAAARNVADRSTPHCSCVLGGCICSGWARLFYWKLKAAVARGDQQALCNGNVVLRITPFLLDAAELASAKEEGSGVAMESLFLHVAMLSKKPWRCTLVLLEAVDANCQPSNIAVPPCWVSVKLKDQRPSVRWLQEFIGDLDPTRAYEVQSCHLSQSQHGLHRLHGQAKITPVGTVLRFWAGDMTEFQHRKQGRALHDSVRLDEANQDERPHEQQEELWGFAAEDIEDRQSESEDAGEEMNFDVDIENLLAQAAAVPSSRVSSTSNSQSSSSSSSTSSSTSSSSSSSSSSSGDEGRGAQGEASGTLEAQQPFDDGRAAIARRVQQETIVDWHGFRITWRPPRKPGERHGSKFGAWQPRCPYHRSRTGTQCKKTLSLPSRDASDSTLRLAKIWCIAALNIATYQDHVPHVPHNDDTAEDLDELAAQLQTQLQGRQLVRDDELEAPAQPKPKAKRQPKSKPAPKKSGGKQSCG